MVFAKPPVAGLAKTRLIPALGAEGAAALHGRLVHHILHVANDAALCPLELWRAGDIDHPFFEDCRARFPLTLQTQQGDDLGQRMHLAFEQALARCDYALLVGSDCPGLTGADLAAGLDALAHGEDCVLSPAEDGGYVLIGLRRTNVRLFDEVAWGTGLVLAQTTARLDELGWRYRLLKHQADIDRPEDLARLPPTLMPPISHKQG